MFTYVASQDLTDAYQCFQRWQSVQAQAPNNRVSLKTDDYSKKEEILLHHAFESHSSSPLLVVHQYRFFKSDSKYIIKCITHNAEYFKLTQVYIPQFSKATIQYKLFPALTVMSLLDYQVFICKEQQIIGFMPWQQHL